jgi:hypothetical protein
MHAFFAEKSTIKADAIAAQQLHALSSTIQASSSSST